MERRCANYIFAYMIANIFLILITYMFSSNFNLVTYCSLIQIVMSVLVIAKYKKDYLLTGVIFLVITYLFHFGQSIITTFSFDDKYAYKNVLSKSGESLYITAEIFAMLCIFSVTVGYLYSSRKTRIDNRNFANDFEDSEMLRIRNIAAFVLIVAAVPMLYIDITKVLTLSIGGYEMTYATYGAGVGKYMNLIGQFGRPAITVLLFSVCKNEKAAKRVFMVSSIYYLVMMLSGDRGTFMIYLITNAFVYYVYCKKIRMRTVIIGAILLYFLFGFVSAISIFRYTDFSYASFVEAFTRRKDDGVVYSILREFGASMLSLTHSINYIPSYTGYNWGLTYLASWLNLSPYLPDVISNIFENSFTFVKAFPTYAADFESLGGSYLGELYFNFGWFGAIFAVFIGAFIGKMDIKLKNSLNPRKVAVYLVLLPTLVLWVRDFFPSMIFKTVWFSVLLLYYKPRRSEMRNESVNNFNR